MEVTFICHSTFWVSTPNAYLLMDWYQTPEGLNLQQMAARPNIPIYILCTHSHPDHYNPTVFELFPNREVHYIFHQELEEHVPLTQRTKTSFIATGETYNGNIQVKAYGSTDLGGSFYIQLPREGMPPTTLFFAGDLNHWHWQEEADEFHQRLYHDHWKQELQRIVNDAPQPQILFFPTDLRLGRGFLRGLRDFLQNIKGVEYLFPMHINGVLNNISPLQEVAQQSNTTLVPLCTPGDSVRLQL